MLLKTCLIALVVVVIVASLALFSMSGHDRHSHIVVFDHITVGDLRIAIHADGEPDAVILHDGTLLIGDAEQPTSDAQKMQLKAYYDNAIALRKAAISAGREGIATASTATASVVKGLASGNPDNIGDEVNRQAAKVDAQAQKIDIHLAAMRKLQNEIVAVIPAFTPYAFME